jgi:flagellar biogenesis protein FliO
MPLHFGKIGAAIALITVAAFVLWLIFTTFFATEQADQQIERTGAVALGASQAS